jgi:HPt (histidine-containing phosphotransfer) domain-containing protein
MSEVVDTPLVFDPAALVSLTGHPDDDELALVVAGRYLRLLPERIRRVRAALRAHDPDTAMDAVLSLRVSSTTVGAGELAALGALIERHLRLVDLPAAYAAAQALGPAAERLEHALVDHLALDEPPRQGAPSGSPRRAPCG